MEIHRRKQRNRAQREIKDIKILVMDDASAAGCGVAWVLAHQGYDVQVARDWAEMEAVLAGFEPELVILDIRMAYVGGVHLCQMIRDRLEYGMTSVIVLAGSSGVDAIERAIAAGCDDYITKPVTDEKLLSVVETHLARGGAL